MEIDHFDYYLPKELIAQYPKEDRSSSRLLVVKRKDSIIHHDIFKNLGNYLETGDVLVLNDTKVIPARLEARKRTGGKVEILVCSKTDENRFQCLVRNAGNGKEIEIKIGDYEATLRKDGKEWFLCVKDEREFLERLFRYGKPPLPPYIRRPPEEKDFERYQTVYARVDGSIAAPTAGLHFTEELIEDLKRIGVEVLFITLHVGVGTFLPVKTKRVEDHRMEKEYYRMEKEVLEKIETAKREGRRILACGTTVVRTLETVFSHDDRPLSGYTDLFIYPGYRFKVVDGLITNFHLPKSTPLLLVSAFIGWENLLKCYREAIEEGYRFYSYGDAMLIL